VGRFVGLIFDTCGQPLFNLLDKSEAVVYDLFSHNKSSHKILGDKTPEEVFTVVKPEISHLRIFGCLVYIHVPVEKRTKLEPSREKGIFVGYNKTSKAYKIFIPT
jgi:hypothetical protein